MHRTPQSLTSSTEEYFTPVVEPSEYRGIDDDIVDCFRVAVRKLHRKSEGSMVCTLSGGMDSRVVAATVAADGLDLPFATHAVREGHDVRIARTIAERLHLRHRVINLPTVLPLDFCSARFLGGSNGALAFDNYHVMWAYPEYAKLGRFVMDGVHTSIEGRWFLRNNSQQARNRDSFFRRTFEALLRPEILKHVNEADRHVHLASAILQAVVPDPADYVSPGCCADVFNVQTVLPNHGADGALLQNNYLRYLSPYLDRDYVSVISRVAEHKRWAQYPQRLIVRKLAPQLLRVPRSYSDILTWPTDNPYLLRMPVALERVNSLLFKQRWPALYHRLSRRSTTLGYDLAWGAGFEPDGGFRAFFDFPGEMKIPGVPGSHVSTDIQSMLHLFGIPT
ncbi:MAG: hypothetical protein IH600_00650 [Bacteroidetes bacterium]|nr:hypothetical protein [Bacteroidota bacterium]